MKRKDIENLGFTSFCGHSDICKRSTWQGCINNIDYEIMLYDDGKMTIGYQDWDKEEFIEFS